MPLAAGQLLIPGLGAYQLASEATQTLVSLPQLALSSLWYELDTVDQRALACTCSTLRKACYALWASLRSCETPPPRLVLAIKAGEATSVGNTTAACLLSLQNVLQELASHQHSGLEFKPPNGLVSGAPCRDNSNEAWGSTSGSCLVQALSQPRLRLTWSTVDHTSLHSLTLSNLQLTVQAAQQLGAALCAGGPAGQAPPLRVRTLTLRLPHFHGVGAFEAFVAVVSCPHACVQEVRIEDLFAMQHGLFATRMARLALAVRPLAPRLTHLSIWVNANDLTGTADRAGAERSTTTSAGAGGRRPRPSRGLLTSPMVKSTLGQLTALRHLHLHFTALSPASTPGMFSLVGALTKLSCLESLTLEALVCSDKRACGALAQGLASGAGARLRYLHMAACRDWPVLLAQLTAAGAWAGMPRLALLHLTVMQPGELLLSLPPPSPAAPTASTLASAATAASAPARVLAPAAEPSSDTPRLWQQGLVWDDDDNSVPGRNADHPAASDSPSVPSASGSGTSGSGTASMPESELESVLASASTSTATAAIASVSTGRLLLHLRRLLHLHDINGSGGASGVGFSSSVSGSVSCGGLFAPSALSPGADTNDDDDNRDGAILASAGGAPPAVQRPCNDDAGPGGCGVAAGGDAGATGAGTAAGAAAGLPVINSTEVGGGGEGSGGSGVNVSMDSAGQASSNTDNPASEAAGGSEASTSHDGPALVGEAAGSGASSSQDGDSQDGGSRDVISQGSASEDSDREDSEDSTASEQATPTSLTPTPPAPEPPLPLSLPGPQPRAGATTSRAEALAQRWHEARQQQMRLAALAALLPADGRVGLHLSVRVMGSRPDPLCELLFLLPQLRVLSLRYSLGFGDAAAARLVGALAAARHLTRFSALRLPCAATGGCRVSEACIGELRGVMAGAPHLKGAVIEWLDPADDSGM